jgi:hypothetical protein
LPCRSVTTSCSRSDGVSLLHVASRWSLQQAQADPGRPRPITSVCRDPPNLAIRRLTLPPCVRGACWYRVPAETLCGCCRP